MKIILILNFVKKILSVFLTLKIFEQNLSSKNVPLKKCTVHFNEINNNNNDNKLTNPTFNFGITHVTWIARTDWTMIVR